jgi:hypothetical protein
MRALDMELLHVNFLAPTIWMWLYISGKLLDISPKDRHRVESCTTCTISLSSGLNFSYILVHLPYGCISKGFSTKFLHPYLVSLHLPLVLTALWLGKHSRSSNQSTDGRFRNFRMAGRCFFSPKYQGRLWDPSRVCCPLGKAAEAWTLPLASI